MRRGGPCVFELDKAQPVAARLPATARRAMMGTKVRIQKQKGGIDSSLGRKVLRATVVVMTGMISLVTGAGDDV